MNFQILSVVALLCGSLASAARSDELTTITCVLMKALVIGSKSFSGSYGMDL